MAEQFQRPRGMRDILPEDHTYFTFIKKVVRHRARQGGFRRITTPVLEERALFERSLGETADAVKKEMYTLETEGGSQLAMRPENTAGVCRAFIENGMKSWPQPVELYYVEPFFRHDRPQKGRYRQFHQFGFECIGECDPALDAQIIIMLHSIYRDLQIDDLLSLQINTIGSLEDREKYLEALREYFTGKERVLGEEGMQMLEKNPLRILDSKDEDIRILVEGAPKMKDSLSNDSKEYFEKVQELLNDAGITASVNPHLVRGLDYYSHTVFEFVDENGLAAGGGGRYDGLIEQLKGPPTPAVGFAAGIERCIDLMKEKKLIVPNKDAVQVFVAQLGWEAKKQAMRITAALREEGIHCLGAIGTSSMKAQLKKADSFGVDYTIILGDVEIREKKAIIRNMTAGRQDIVPIDTVVKEILAAYPKNQRDTYDPSADLTTEEMDPADELLIRE